MALPVTALAAGYSGALLASLAFPVGVHRKSTSLSHGTGAEDTTGKHKDFEQRIRAHGNATENIPIFLIILGLLENNKVLSQKSLLGLAGAFCLARTTHSIQLLLPRKVPLIFRAVGFVSQQALILGLGVTLAVSAIKKLRA
mmetsp:Transcript_19565/g.42453  ORF Transcript_19565/g.42453 Transcript_19565/m.42453 type:complete len:142 (-) Transcript_19565:679-1104(-)